jgi:hypothetical protein
VNRSRAVRTAVPLTAIVIAAGAGAWALRSGAAPASRSGGERIAPAAYHTFDGCPALLSYLRTQARPLVGPYGLADAGGPIGPIAVAEGAPAPRASMQAGEGAADAGATSSTGTNVQVAGVDEVDVSKRSGDLVLTVTGTRNGLTVLRTSGSHAEVAGRLATGWHPEGLLVDGTRVLLIGSLPYDAIVPRTGTAPSTSSSGYTVSRAPAPLDPLPTYTPRTRVTEVDVSDPEHPRLVRTLDLDGSSVGARLSDGVLRLAVSAAPSGLRFVQPRADEGTSGSSAEAVAKARNLSVVAGSTVQEWLPGYTLTPAGGRGSSGTLLDCSRIGVPDRFSGLRTLALLTFDLRTQGVSRWQGAGVVAGGTTLYATGDHTYVTTTDWRPRLGAVRGGPLPDSPVVPTPVRTRIHEFATDAGGVRYLGSGQVDGSLIGQYALDEYQGRLRVATTTGPGWPDGIVRPLAEPGVARAADAAGTEAVPTATSSSGTSAPGTSAPGTSAQGGSGAPPDGDGSATVTDVPVPTVPRPTAPRATAATSSSVTVLQLRDGKLSQVGQVSGLGRGETIHAVRFAGPVGYVVTFRRTDPLFALDLSDPANPKVAGELALLGYSAYLHPLGDGLLLGVGQDAGSDGITRGVLMSLFDVTDPAHPKLLDRVTLPGEWSGTESDPHAFTYAAGLAMVPLQSGVLAVPVEGRSLGSPAVLQVNRGGRTEGLDAGAMRTFADGRTLWTVAAGPDSGVLAANDAHDLQLLSSLPF